MKEKLHTIPVIGDGFTILGYADTRDDFGNRLSGFQIKCASGKTVKLTSDQFLALHHQLGDWNGLNPFGDGIIEVPLGETSPLVSYCGAPAPKRARDK